MTGSNASRRDHAVVLGAGVAGIVAARVLADTHRNVTIIDRDDLAGTGQRRGVPQGWHPHVLLDAGRLVVEELFPGITEELQSGGAPIAEPLVQTRSYLAGLAVLSDDPATQQAAWTFIRFMTSDAAFTTITSEIGYLPLRPAIVDDPAYLKDYFARDPRLLPSLAQLDDVTPYTSFPGDRANEAVVVLQDEAVEPIVLRGADPEATLGAVAAKIRGLVAP